jgi:hypothetical protein
MLLLEHKGAPMMIKCETVSGNRSSYHTAQVLLRCELERDYALSITPKNIASQGLNTVLGAVDKGVERLKPTVDLYRDYGCPEVTQGRTIKTDDPDFTQLVLRDLDLRQCLLAQPRFGLRVGASAPSCMPAPMHLITAWCNLEGLGCDWDLADVDWLPSPEEQRARLEEKNFGQKLDTLIALCKAARGAVMAWRMPEQKKKND